MSSDTSPPSHYRQKYTVTKTIQLLKTLRRLEFFGRSIWTTANGDEWTIWMNAGQPIYAASRHHEVRRWQRHLLSVCPHLSVDIPTLEAELYQAGKKPFTIANSWIYHLLQTWIDQEKITRQQASYVVEQTLIEIIFDIAQATDVTYQLHRDPPLIDPQYLILVDEETVFSSAQNQWFAWFNAELENRSPNLAPVIQQPEQIKAATSETTYQMLTTLLDGKHTLRDLAAKTQKDVLSLTLALHPYLQIGWLELIEVLDYPTPNLHTKKIHPSSGFHSNSLLIACVDDSSMMCRSMESVIKAAGYQFIAIMDASRAIATLLAKKPDLIFLDLIMPETNGYEICSQLRKVSLFKETPIIILTGNDGLVDQVRARLLGATDFLSKPMEPAIILSMIQKHLGQTALA